MTTLLSLLESIMSRSQRLIETLTSEDNGKSLSELCQTLVSTRGEVSEVVLANRILSRYRKLDQNEQRAFFHKLADRFDVDPKQIRSATDHFIKNNSPDALAQLMSAVEPPRQELFRRLNLAPRGTAALVSLRKNLLDAIPKSPTLKRIDLDLVHLFDSWFNRGFLILRPIDWSTSADLLEKIIQYEAVHEIGTWEELRRRLKPADRRCFAFFHPSMPDEPLIFVEVALTKGIPLSISSVLAEDREELGFSDITTAVFYSISNCQQGLRGISFGSFLIKQVVQELINELPHLRTFVTLSPVPGFMKWLYRQSKREDSKEIAEMYAIVKLGDWTNDSDIVLRLSEFLPQVAADYLINAKHPDGWPLDPVARFHLGNGAILDRVNWLADTSPRGLKTAAGIMVNYRYDLSKVEDNHEAYAKRKEVKASRKVLDYLT